MQVCDKHDELVKAIGEHTSMLKTYGLQLHDMSQMLSYIKEVVDRNAVRAEQRDKALDSLESSIEKIDRKIENGLKQKITEAAENFKKLQECIDRRKREQDAELYSGFLGYFRRGFEAFKDRSAYIVVTTLIITIFISFVLLMVKLGIHQLVPQTILGLFGIKS